MAGPTGNAHQFLKLALCDRLAGERPTTGRTRCDPTSVQGVRRAEAALSSGCKPHPATAPAGSNRSSHGGNVKPSISVSQTGDSASVQAATRVKRRAILENDNAQVDPATLPGKTDTSG